MFELNHRNGQKLKGELLELSGTDTEAAADVSVLNRMYE